MDKNKFPFNQYDVKYSGDANAQHLLYLLEGYRAAVLLGDIGNNPYSPGSARSNSWEIGFKQAEIDIVTL